MRRFQYFVLSCLALLFLATTAGAAESADSKSVSKLIVGIHSRATAVDLDLELPAKMDTGASTSSLHAVKIRRYKKDGKSMVSFKIEPGNDKKHTQWKVDGDTGQTFRLPLHGHTRIKKRAEDHESGSKTYHRRPSVMMTLCVGGHRAEVEVNLTDRRRFREPLLVGSAALEALHLVVDPAESGKIKTRACRDPESESKSSSEDKSK